MTIDFSCGIFGQVDMGDAWKTKSVVLGETEERGKTAESLTIRITQDLNAEAAATEDLEETEEIPELRRLKS